MIRLLGTNQELASIAVTDLSASRRGVPLWLVASLASSLLAGGCGHGGAVQPASTGSESAQAPLEGPLPEPLAGELPSARPMVAVGAEALPDGRRCIGDGQVYTREIAPGVLRYTCRAALTTFEHRALQHGPELDVVTIACKDGSSRSAGITRSYSHGEQVGVESGKVEGKLVYRLRLDAGRHGALALPAAEAEESGGPAAAAAGVNKVAIAPVWATAKFGPKRCTGTLLCGRMVGYAECVGGGVTHRGAQVDGVADGPGERNLADGSRHVGSFVADRASGPGVHIVKDGTELHAWFVGRLASGYGRTRFPDGGWRAALYINGRREGRATRAWPDGRREVSNWRNGVKLSASPLPPFTGSLAAVRKAAPEAPPAAEPGIDWLAWTAVSDRQGARLLIWRVRANHEEGADELSARLKPLLKVRFGLEAKDLHLEPVLVGYDVALARLISASARRSGGAMVYVHPGTIWLLALPATDEDEIDALQTPMPKFARPQDLLQPLKTPPRNGAWPAKGAKK